MKKLCFRSMAASANPSAQRRKIRLPDVGEIVLERSQRAKKINLTVRPFKGVRVAVPDGVSFQEAFEAAQAHTAWIQKQIIRLKSVEAQAVLLEQPVFINRTVARNVIVERLAELARRHGFSYNRVFIRNQKTRWGSCSAKNNINLNLNLVRLPTALMDYVLLHELLHTRIKNHSPNYWQAMEELLPDAKCLDRELNRYEAMLAQ